MKLAAWSLLFGLAQSGCAAQLTSGPEWAGNGPARAGITMTGTLQALRKSNGVVGVRVNSVAHEGYTLKSAMLHGGYDWLPVPGVIAFEPGFDFGVGQAVRPVFEGAGAYAGVSATLRLRIPTRPLEPAFNLAFPMFEVVLLPRAGGWMPPEGAGSTLYFEGGLELGLRFAVGSDLTTSGQGHVWDGGSSCQHEPCNENEEAR